MSDAVMSRAVLSRADLSGADLSGADLSDAVMSDAVLRDADLSPIKADVWMVLTLSGRREAEGLLSALCEGRIDGTQYEGVCACLVGTIANVRGCHYDAIPGLAPDSGRPSERWFLGITKGDTPETNQIAKLAAEWIEEWLACQPAEAGAK
jgi:hypothetical protein